MILIIFNLFIAALSSGNGTKFPADFKFCVSTSAHQIEGQNTNSDWWRFEQKRVQSTSADLSGDAVDHWNRLEEDTELLKNLGVDQYRFSIEWAKIEPSPGQIDRAAIEHYQKELLLLKAAGISPLVTLHHFTLPRWFEMRGGWTNPNAPQLFNLYTKIVYDNLGQYIADWSTFNEPMTTLAGGYLAGTIPPERKDLFQIKAIPIINLLKAHAAAYKTLHALAKKENRKIRVGIAHHLRIFDAKSSWNPIEVVGAKVFSEAWNWAILDALHTGVYKLSIPFAVSVEKTITGLKGSQDYIGVNYYTRDRVHFTGAAPLGFSLETSPNAELSDNKWEIYPEGLTRILDTVSAKYPKLPIFITENGLADSKDEKRTQFVRDHLRVILNAIHRGINVQNYCHWTLVDNFEWLEGYKSQFGFYSNDRATQKRTLRKSGEWFSKIVRSRSLEN